MVLSTTAILVLNHKTPCTQILFSPLFLLMPRRLWLIKLYSPQQGFNIVELTSVEIYNTVRQVLDVNRYYTIHYTIAGRTLIHVFSVCKNRMISWNQMWANNVGNDYGQVIMSVLTTGEGYWLSPTIHGLIRRYKEADVLPLISSIMTDCCGNHQFRRMF